MFITKKKFERAIEKAQDEALRKVDERNREFEVRKRINECFSDIEKRLCAIEKRERSEDEACAVNPSKYWV